MSLSTGVEQIYPIFCHKPTLLRSMTLRN